MPRVSWDTEADWNAHYRVWDATQGVHVGYERQAMYAFFPRRWALIEQHFPAIATTDRILVGGCGFGWLIEAAHAAGYPNVWGIDYSTHIQTNRGTQSDGSVLFVEDDITGGGRIKAALRSLTGDDIFNWIITESVLEGYDDAEMPQMLAAAESVLDSAEPTTNILHLVHATPHGTFGSQYGLDPVFNVKSIDEWKAIEPTHTWVNIISSAEWEVR